MQTALLLIAASFTISWLVTGGLVRWLPTRGVVDVPNARSSHSLPVPRGGGIGILAGLIAGLLLARGLGAEAPAVAILFGAFMMAALSLVDDVLPHGLDSRLRIAMQLAASAVVVYQLGGFATLPFPAPLALPLGFFGNVLAILWLTGVTNLYNFLDGIDGFSASQGVLAGVAVAILDPGGVLATAGLAVAASCVGFLLYNWHPARIFMGDVGSTTLGFLFAALPFQRPGAERGEAAFAVAICLWFFLSDGTFTLLRRAVRREPFWKPHRSHLYQRLVRAGLQHNQVVCRIALPAMLVAALAIAAVRLHRADLQWLTLLTAVTSFALYVVWTRVAENRWEKLQQQALSGPAASNASTSVQGSPEPVNLPRQAFMEILNRCVRRAGRVLASRRRLTVFVFQLLLPAASLLLAFNLRFDFAIPEDKYRLLWIALAVAIPVKTCVFRLAQLSKLGWRYVTAGDLIHILRANAAASVVCGSIVYVLLGVEFPRSIYLLDLLICAGLEAGVRCLIRVYMESQPLSVRARTKPVLIYGVSDTGIALLRETKANAEVGIRVVGFVDDDPEKANTIVMGVPVLGPGNDLHGILDRLPRADRPLSEIIVAMPRISGRHMRDVLANCRAAGLSCKTIPAVTDMLRGRVLARQIRDVSVTDLLGREPAHLDEEQILGHLEGRSVLVTGGAGSIGSELCRQIAGFNPRVLVMFDQAESEVFKLDTELRAKFPNLNLVAEIGDIVDLQHVEDVLRKHHIERVFHAAAYKHVPLMEAHVLEAVRNNIIGTWNVATASRRLGVSSFLMISSDKAVNPTSIMGVTKRIAELIVTAISDHADDGGAKFVSVRFGNVLGSNGSVVPLFQAMIEQGGPLTVTHPDMRRYFMSIPEAVQLVLQASTMGNGSEVFILDMGEPVRIVDLARNMIRLAGLEPDEDIEIRFTGIRAGEKLFEELTLVGEEFVATQQDQIKICRVRSMEWDAIQEWMRELQRLMQRRQGDVLVEHMQILVPEYIGSLRKEPARMTGSVVGVAAG